MLQVDAPRGDFAGFHTSIPWYEYLHSQGWAIARYLRLVVLPVGLALDYGSSPIAHWRGVPGLILLAILAVITAWCWSRASRWGWLAFAGSCFFLVIAPSSSIVPIATEIAAERRMYLPLAAILAVLVIAVHRALRGAPRLRRPAAVAAVVLLAALTFERSRLYADPVAIWRDATEKFPDNARAWYNLGVATAAVPALGADRAESYFRETIARDSTHADALLRVLVAEFQRHEIAAAKVHLRQYPLTSGNDTVLAGLGKVLFATGDTVGATLALERAAESGTNVETLVTLSALYLIEGRTDDAIVSLRKAAALDPGRQDVAQTLARLQHP